MSKTASIVACSLVASIFSFNAQAFSALSAPRVTAPDIIEVRGFCGLGFHRGPYGGCVPNGVPYGYVAPGRSALCGTRCSRAARGLSIRLLLLCSIRPQCPDSVTDTVDG
jgi:hypothetical protein